MFVEAQEAFEAAEKEHQEALELAKLFQQILADKERAESELAALW